MAGYHLTHSAPLGNTLTICHSGKWHSNIRLRNNISNEQYGYLTTWFWSSSFQIAHSTNVTPYNLLQSLIALQH